MTDYQKNRALILTWADDCGPDESALAQRLRDLVRHDYVTRYEVLAKAALPGLDPEIAESLRALASKLD